jgi:hypothetical protein
LLLESSEDEDEDEDGNEGSPQPCCLGIHVGQFHENDPRESDLAGTTVVLLSPAAD